MAKTLEAKKMVNALLMRTRLLMVVAALVVTLAVSTVSAASAQAATPILICWYDGSELLYCEIWA